MINIFRRIILFVVLFATAAATHANAQSRPFVNISSRAQVLNGQDALIVGFIVNSTATATKQVVIRGIGPSTGVPGSLSDPTITLNGPNGPIYSNNNWRDTQQNEIAATGLQPNNDLESAIIWTLPSGNYTAVLTGNDGGTGVGTVEVYETAGTPPIVNLSSRAQVGTGDGVLIGGLIVQDSTRAVVRAIGPSLQNYGVQGAIQNPTVELRDGSGTLVAANDDWGTDPGSGEIQHLGLQPANPYESAILPTLPSGNYTAIVRGVNDTTGVGSLEVYALEDATYPRVFQAWANADNFNNEDPTVTVSRHDLLWTTHNGFGWYWPDANGDPYTGDYRGETVTYTGARAYDIPTLRALNPKIKILCEVPHYEARVDTGDPHLPADSPWWKRVNGQLKPSLAGGGRYELDQDNPSLQDHVANQARALMQTGQFDGVMLDECFKDTSYLQTLLAKVRNAIGQNGLIIVNANANQLSTGELGQINGVFMESGNINTSNNSGTPQNFWNNVKSALDYNELYTRAPHVNCLETWFVTSRTDPTDLKRMRLTTALSLVHSNGFALFGDPNHNHQWYDPFWSGHKLGRPTGDKQAIQNTTNAQKRDFVNGTAVCNPGTSQITVTFDEIRTRLPSTPNEAPQSGTSFAIPALDGGIFIK